MKKVFPFIILFLISFPIAVFAEDDIVLATGNTIKITMSDFMRIVHFYDPEKQKILEQNPQMKVNLLKRIVQGMIISKMAKDKGFDTQQDIKHQIELLSNDFITTEYIKREIIAEIGVTEDDMKFYYKAHQEDFQTPAMVRARHILVKVDKSASEEEQEKAEVKAKNILKKIKDGEDFAKLASELSDDPGSKTKGGDLGFFSKGKMIPDFEKVAFSLKIGEVSDVFETPFGFHIVKVEEKKDSFTEPYEKVQERIKGKLLTDLRKVKVEDFIGKAMKDSGVEINFEPLLQKK